MDQKIPLHSSHSEEGKQNQEEKQIFQDFKKEETETEEAETRINKKLKPFYQECHKLLVSYCESVKYINIKLYKQRKFKFSLIILIKCDRYQLWEVQLTTLYNRKPSPVITIRRVILSDIRFLLI